MKYEWTPRSHNMPLISYSSVQCTNREIAKFLNDNIYSLYTKINNLYDMPCHNYMHRILFVKENCVFYYIQCCAKKQSTCVFGVIFRHKNNYHRYFNIVLLSISLSVNVLCLHHKANKIVILCTRWSLFKPRWRFKELMREGIHVDAFILSGFVYSVCQLNYRY